MIDPVALNVFPAAQRLVGLDMCNVADRANVEYMYDHEAQKLYVLRADAGRVQNLLAAQGLPFYNEQTELARRDFDMAYGLDIPEGDEQDDD